MSKFLDDLYAERARIQEHVSMMRQRVITTGYERGGVRHDTTADTIAHNETILAHLAILIADYEAVDAQRA